MRIEDNHAHAYTRYSLLGLQDIYLLFKSAFETKLKGYKTLTVHLPFEIQHPQVTQLTKALVYIYYGEILKKIFNIKLYWENAPYLNYGTWNLKFGNTNWENIPKNIDICLDTGHLMLGIKDRKQFLSYLRKILEHRGKQIKHLHLHENDLESDKHTKVPGKILSKKIINLITKNRSFIFEKGE